MDSIILRENEDMAEGGMVFEINSLYAYLERIADFRKPKGKRYKLATILLFIILAKLGGQDKPSGITEWVVHRQEGILSLLKLPRKCVPHYCTYRRILEKMDPELFEQAMGAYQRSCLKAGSEVIISIDGKALRGTIPAGAMRGVHLLAAYLPGSGLVLMEVAVDSKENEIVAAPTLLMSIDLNGAIVIGDAMHTQRKISIQIVEAGGHFIWTAKGNQARTEWAIEKLFVNEVCNLKKGAPLSKDFQMASQINKGHGRIEKRTLMVSQALNDYLDWPYVAQVFRLVREVWRTCGRTRQVIYGLTDMSPLIAPPKRLLSLLRGYWGIENGLHYRRDVTLQEDGTRTSTGHVGHNLAIINNLIVALCLSHDFHNVARARRLFDAKPELALDLILHP